MSQSESFLRRWSRLKLDASTEAPPTPVSDGVLPSLDDLDFSSDFSQFMGAGVDGETRRQALSKLFMTDHYRAMDGLDVYVEDFSRPALLSPALLQTLDHAQSLLAVREDASMADDSPRPPEQS